MTTGSNVFPAYRVLKEPPLLFGPERREQDVHPLRGLLRFGPFSGSLLAPVLTSLRLGVIAPRGEANVVERLVQELRGTHKPRERAQYLPPFPGFRHLFGVDLEITRTLELPAEVDAQLTSDPAPHRILAEHLTRAATTLSTARTEFDVLTVYLPTRWQSGFEGPAGEDFDLHDYLKAVTASLDIPSQILRQDKAMEYFCRCSVAWRLSIAMYTKVGGVPWKLANSTPDTAYVGLSYALRGGEGEPRFVTCCSQVFDSDGAGLEFVAYEMQRNQVRVEKDNPFLTREQMRTVMARSLSLYQQRHAGLTPRRVVVHKSTEFKPDEVEGCFDAWSVADEIELIQVQQDTPWRGVRMLQNRERRAYPDSWPLHRGTLIYLSGREVLLWTQGDVQSLAQGSHYFKEGRGIPRPLLLRRFAGGGAADQFSRDVLGLTKMNWNNDAPYDLLPTTLEYASTLARVIKRMPRLAPRPYPFRLFM